MCLYIEWSQGFMPCMIEIDMLKSLKNADFTETSPRNHLSELSSIEWAALQVDPTNHFVVGSWDGGFSKNLGVKLASL